MAGEGRFRAFAVGPDAANIGLSARIARQVVVIRDRGISSSEFAFRMGNDVDLIRELPGWPVSHPAGTTTQPLRNRFLSLRVRPSSLVSILDGARLTQLIVNLLEGSGLWRDLHNNLAEVMSFQHAEKCRWRLLQTFDDIFLVTNPSFADTVGHDTQKRGIVFVGKLVVDEASHQQAFGQYLAHRGRKLVVGVIPIAAVLRDEA